MKQYTIMIKPASSLCNLRCRYCFYADETAMRSIRSYGIMTTETADKLIDQVLGSLQSNDAITFAFQGGEPMLAGLDFFRHFTAQVEQRRGNVKVSYALQTNGTALNEEWCKFLKAHQFLVGISMDIAPAYHNAARVSESGKGTFELVNHNRLMMEKYGVEYNVLSVLTKAMARHPVQVWKAIVAMNLKFVQFIPCMEEMQEGVDSPFSLTPKRFAQFYNGLFPLWLDAFRHGKYISIKFFDDVINLLSLGMVTACGLTGQCINQTIVEADGSTYPCDFYVLDDYYMGNICEKSMTELDASDGVKAFFGSKEPLPETCHGCRYEKLCGGGCRRMRKSMYVDGDYCGYRDFLDRNTAGLEAVVQYLQSQPQS